MKPFFNKLLLSLLLVSLGTLATAQNFSVQGTKIYDPNGKEFVPIGANVNAFNYGSWEYGILDQREKDAWLNCWKFNFMRGNLNLKDAYWEGKKVSDGIYGHGPEREAEGFAAIDAMVKAYTSQKVVVMLEVHDFTCGIPSDSDLDLLKKFWLKVAEIYKNNPYVWFNLWNEPFWSDAVSAVPVAYRDVHREIISVIRDQAKANNIIVVSGAQCGQDAKSWDNTAISESKSGILKYGQEILSYNGKTYGNIAFSFHMYDQWGRGYGYFDTKMRDYLKRVHAKNLAIFIGEVGGRGDSNDPTGQLAYEIALKEFNVGVVAWHWAPKDGHRLVDNPGYRGFDINSCTAPTNLSPWLGKYLWKATHEDGYGLGSTPPADTQAPSVPTGLTSTGKTSSSVSLSWTASTDNVGVTGYDVFVNGTYNRTSSNTSTTVSGLAAGTSYSFTVKAKDAAGNLSAASSALSVTTSSASNLIANGEFDNGTNSWNTYIHSSASAQLEVVTGQGLSGTNAGKMGIPSTGAGTYDWHVQLKQTIGITSGKTYNISFMAKAGAARALRVGIQQEGGSNTVYWEQSLNIGTTAGTYNYSFTANTTDATAGLKFFCGASSTDPIIDKVSVTETSSARLAFGEQGNDTRLVLYPNPARDKLTVEYYSPEKGKVSLALLNQLSQPVQTSQVEVEQGLNRFELGLKATTGVYFLRLSTGKGAGLVRKIVVTR